MACELHNMMMKVLLPPFLPLRTCISLTYDLNSNRNHHTLALFHFYFKAKLAEQNLSDRTKLLEMKENYTSLKLQQQTGLLQQELTKMFNRGK